MPNPVIVLKGVKHDVLQNVIEFMYTGETQIPNTKTGEFFQATSDMGLKEMAKVSLAKDKVKEHLIKNTHACIFA